MKRAFWHPVLFSIFPILFLYARNAGEMNLSEILLPFCCAVVGTIILLFLLKFLLADPDKRALLVTFFVLSFFSFGHLTGLIRSSGLFSGKSNLVGLSLIIFIFIVTVLLIFILKKSGRNFTGLTRVLNAVAIILIAVQIVVIAYSHIDSHDESMQPTNMDALADLAEQLPDIYYLIFDGYAREDILKEMYNYDNSHFLKELKSRGFYIADSSYSNYCATAQSLASSLNLDYLQSLATFNSRAFSRTPLARMIDRNRVFDFLKKLNYKIVAFMTGHSPTQIENADYYFKPGVTLSEFQNTLLNTTALSVLLDLTKSQFDIHRDRISYILDKVGRLDDIESPKMIFTHLISPHPPFLFTKDGEATQRDWPFSFADGDHYTIQGGTTEEYINGYRDQLHYISGQILVTVDNIIESSETPPVIILQADHGPGSGLFWGSASKSNMVERFSILNAYYLPGFKNQELLTPDLSPVNSFRLILSEYYKLDLELLPNYQFFTTRARPYRFIDVTGELE
jgi:hypothetical protein